MEHIVFIEATITGAGLKGIESAKKRNMEISFFTGRKSSYEAKNSKDVCILDLVDRVIEVNTNSIEDVCYSIKELNNIHPITAITTFADFYVPQAAVAAECIGLPTIPYKAALNARNKYFTRTMIANKAPELNPQFYLINSEEEAAEESEKIGYPLVMKPQDENDSFDVVLINSKDELIYHFKRIMSKQQNRVGQKKAPGGVLIEEYIKGQEYSVETFQGGPNSPLQLMGITRKYLTGINRGCFVEVGHCFPVFEHKEEIFNAVSTVIEALGIHTAACHTEVKLTNSGVKIIEINPRLAGGKIGSHLIEITTGINPVDLVVDCARGLNPVWNGVYNCGAAIYNIASPIKGKIRSLPDISLLNRPEVVQFKMPSKIGQDVYPPCSNGDLIGQVIVKEKDADTAFLLAKNIIESINFNIN